MSTQQSNNVENFYTSSYGFKMANIDYFNPEIKDYLIQEQNSVSQIIEENSIEFIIEAGCGYGRYSNLAREKNLGYIGVELSKVYIQMFQHIQEKYPTSQRDKINKIENESIYNIHEILEKNKKNIPPGKTLIILPFNLFGNLEHTLLLLKIFNNLNVKIFISNFNSSELSTTIRKDYYEICNEVQVFEYTDRKGVLLKSNDLHSYAYNSDHIKFLFEKSYLEILKEVPLTNIGIGYLLESKKFTENDKRLYYRNDLKIFNCRLSSFNFNIINLNEIGLSNFDRIHADLVEASPKYLIFQSKELNENIKIGDEILIELPRGYVNRSEHLFSGQISQIDSCTKKITIKLNKTGFIENIHFYELFI